MGAGCAKLAWTLPPVPIGPAAALIFPPIVTFPPIENARTASSVLSTTTKSVISAPIWSPQPRPPVAMHEGADHEPSGRRAMTRPEPALPEKTNPAFKTWKTASPCEYTWMSNVCFRTGYQGTSPLARWRTAFGMAFKAVSGWPGSAEYVDISQVGRHP
jgi:hypothetical protein